VAGLKAMDANNGDSSPIPVKSLGVSKTYLVKVARVLKGF